MREGWEIKRLGDICEFVRGPFGGSLKKSVFRKQGYAVYEQQHAINNQFSEIRYFIDDEKFNEMKRFEVFPGDLIMSCSGTMGRVAIVPKNVKRGIINQALLKLSPSKNINNRFLKMWMESESFQDSLKDYSQGAAIQNVASVKILKEIPFPFPRLDEQNRIVKILEEAFATIEKAKANIEKNLQNSKELFESYLQNVFLESNEDWEKKTLGEVCEFINRGTSPKYVQGHGLYVLNQKCIRDHKINFEFARQHDERLKSVSSERLIRLGDVLVNSTGTGTLGRVAQVRELKHRATVDSHVTIVRPREELFNYKFFSYCMILIEEEITNSGEGASGQTELSRDVLKNNFNILYPKSITLQETISEKLDKLSLQSKMLVIIYQQKLNDLEELKKSLLQKAFNGELAAATKNLVA